MSRSSTWEIELPPNIENLGLEHLNKVCSCRRRVFTTDEDKYLAKLVTSKECTNWFEVAQKIPGRSPRQCRDRWTNYLCPTNSFEPWTPEEDQKVIDHVNELGTRWSLISKLVPGRSDNCIKNRWYSGLKSQCAIDQQGKYYLRSSIKPSSIEPKPSNKAPQPKATLTEENSIQPIAPKSNSTSLVSAPVTTASNTLFDNSNLQNTTLNYQVSQPQPLMMYQQVPSFSQAPNVPIMPRPLYPTQIQQAPLQQQHPFQPISFFLSEFDQNDLKSSFETPSTQQNDEVDEDDFWDNQLYKQIIGISQDPFSAAPDLFGSEWF